MWTWLKDATFWCIDQLQQFCGDWGLAIIIVTILIRLILFPITASQTKSTYAMQKVQPKIKEIQEKYANDQQRMNEELMKIYADNKFNPMAGCLPMLIQMPVFIVLYQTLREYIPQGASFYNIIPNLADGLNTVWGQGFVACLPYATLMILFAVSTFVPMLLTGNRDKNTLMMGAFMSVFMLWIGWSAPAGVMLYWVGSSIFGIAQQQITTRIMKREDAQAAAEAASKVVVLEPVQVSVERRVKKKKPTKKR